MRLVVHALIASLILLAGCAAGPPRTSIEELQKQVADTERGFAKSMADRSHAAFMSYLSDEAIFFTGPVPLRGKQAVADAWKRFYEKPEAPFSWEPEKVQVLSPVRFQLACSVRSNAMLAEMSRSNVRGLRNSAETEKSGSKNSRPETVWMVTLFAL